MKRQLAYILLICFAALLLQPMGGMAMADSGEEYVISYDVGGGSGGPAPQIKLEGVPLALSTEVPTWPGHDFVGWTVLLTAEYYDPGDYFFSDCDTTLTAIWDENGEPVTYTITYDANGGVGAPGSQQKPQGEAVGLSGIAPTREGYTFQGWATDKNADVAEYAPGDTYDIDGNVILYALWKQAKPQSSFDVMQDAFAFPNTKDSFGYAVAGSGDLYPIPYDPSVKLLFGDTTGGKNAHRNQVRMGWTGNCCGFSTAAALLFAYDDLSPEDFGRENTVSLTIGDMSGDLSVKVFIEAMQFSQNAPQFSRDWQNNRLYNNDLANGSSLDKLFNAVSRDVEQGKGTILAIVHSSYGGHALLAYGVEHVSDTEEHLLIYDSNHPMERRVMTLGRRAAGAPITDWRYDMGGRYGVWGTDHIGDPCSISFIPYDTIEYIWTHRGRLYDNLEMLSVDIDTFAIMDYDGRQIASVNGGILESDHSDIICVPNLSLINAGQVSLYMPRDYYTVSAPGNAEFEATMADYKLGATAWTTSGAVSFAVDDSTRSNTVYIEGASTEDTYWVSLDSGYGNVQYNNVTISGTGKGESICISGDRDTLSIANCNIDSLSINGVEQVSFMVSAYAGAGGTISPAGDVKVAANGEQRFEIIPKLGYAIDKVKVDDIDMGAISEYTFESVLKEHKIAALFRRTYAVTGIELERTTGKVTVALQNEAKARLVCALYSESGEMLAASVRSIAANCGEAGFAFANVNIPGHCRVKAMIVDSKWIPLCAGFEITD